MAALFALRLHCWSNWCRPLCMLQSKAFIKDSPPRVGTVVASQVRLLREVVSIFISRHWEGNESALCFIWRRFVILKLCVIVQVAPEVSCFCCRLRVIGQIQTPAWTLGGNDLLWYWNRCNYRQGDLLHGPMTRRGGHEGWGAAGALFCIGGCPSVRLSAPTPVQIRLINSLFCDA